MALFDRKKPTSEDQGQTTLDVAVVESRTVPAPAQATGGELDDPQDGESVPAPRRAPDRPQRSKPKALPSAEAVPSVDTRIGLSVILEGTLRFTGAAHIDGVVRGKVISKGHLEVGPDATLAAEVHVGALVLHGTIEGNVTADERVEIHADGELRGDLRTPALRVEDGALFFGHCEMGRDE
jgi:cytoskeletal protein CcmA (bactofilin family)